MEGAVIFSLFLMGTGAWLIFLGLTGIRGYRNESSETDDPFEVDEPGLQITVVGISLIMGLAAFSLGLYILFA